jgi:hypothetical protein
MIAAIKEYANFILDYRNNYNHNWKAHLSNFIGVAIATVLVDFVWDLGALSGSFVFFILLLVFEFIWLNILFILRKHS